MKATNILIVDDHTMIRDGISSILNELDHYKIVGEASNGKQALDFVQNNEVDMIIMDINMPLMNGIECTRIIRELYPHIKVLTLTMHDEELYLAKMMEAGAVGYILKDSGRDELLKALDAITGGKHYFSPEITINVIRELTSPSKSSPEVKNPLTNREQEVLDLIVKEYSNQEIAETLNISIRTVDAHRRNLLEKTGSRNTAGLVKFALNLHRNTP